MVIWNSPSRPRKIDVDQGRPDQTKTDQGRQKQTNADQGRPRLTKTGQSRPRQTKADQGRPKQAKADQGRPRQTKADQGRPKQTKADKGRPKQASGWKRISAVLPASPMPLLNQQNKDIWDDDKCFKLPQSYIFHIFEWINIAKAQQTFVKAPGKFFQTSESSWYKSMFKVSDSHKFMKFSAIHQISRHEFFHCQKNICHYKIKKNVYKWINLNVKHD